MNILLIGSGGREHCFAQKLSQSPLCKSVFIAPGNAGTAGCGTNLPIAITDFVSLAAAAIKLKIDIVLVGPEEPLVKGITDFFNEGEYTKHIHVIGPGREAAQLEGSKAYAKAFMNKHKIPTATFKEFTEENFTEGIEYIKQHSLPVVLKADGLAAGKGVLICHTYIEALSEFELMIHRSKFGDAGKKVVIESFLTGIEMSVFLLTDGKNYLMLPEAKDYKRIGEGDTGLNTGGMGAVSPVPLLDAALREKIITKIAEPTIKGLKNDLPGYKGFVFVGLMVDDGEPTVIEYNCRMGDPETEVVIPRINNDFAELLKAVAEQRLNEIVLDITDQTAVGIVAVSGGYPGEHNTGYEITGLKQEGLPETMIYHGGTKREADKTVTNGGRVLVAVSFGENIKEAAEQSDYYLQHVYFEGMNYRTDIGYEFI
jgi:phosphoribosylamine---glycine ligase